MTKKEFLQTIEDFLSRPDMVSFTFDMEAWGDPTLVFDFRKGRECREETQNNVLRFIAEYQS